MEYSLLKTTAQMNETILNGLLNLFAIFASIARMDNKQAVQALHSYLSSHFGVRSHDEYIGLYNELKGMYDDPFFPIDKENVIRNICTQMKVKLTAEEQMLLLIRFIEFAYTHNRESADQLDVFHIVACIFSVSDEEYDHILAFVTGKPSPSLLYIDGQNGDTAQPNHITREGLEGHIVVFFIERFDKYIFTYHGDGVVYMNDIPLAPGMFYTWQHSSVLKSPLFLPVYHSDLKAVFQQKERHDTVYLTGRDIEFTFPNSRNGIHDFSFDLESGQLVAIMGGSGVGKSTLLGLMTGSLSPNKGSIQVNGHPINSPDSKQLIGFVPQDDLLIEELTVYENLWFTARFCFDRFTKEELSERVETVLKDLDLLDFKDLKVGSPMRKTISGGQRKRLNIALELIREPAILYLDEPTSGLSSADSEKVMMLLKEQTHRGRLVVVNIHQPSSEIYKLFDRLWLLDKGGYPIYDGNPIEAVTYFKRAAQYTDQDISVCSACGNINPELILTIIDSKMIDDSGNQTNIRKFSPEEWHRQYLSRRRPSRKVKEHQLPLTRQQKPPRWKQLQIFIERNLRTKLTNKQYILLALCEAPLLAILVAYLTRFTENSEYTLFANKNFISYIFMSVIVVTFIGLSISAEEIFRDRIILKREHFLRLSRGSYLTSKISFLFVLSGVQTALFLLIGNTITGVPWDMFPAWWSILWLTAFVANLTGLILSQTLSSIVAIYITIPLLLIPQILLCGLVVRFDELDLPGTEKNQVPLVGEMIPSRWAFEALVVDQFADNDFNRPYFPIEREKYLAQFYRNIQLPAVRSLINRQTIEKDNNLQELIDNELTILSAAARITPMAADESYDTYFDRADKALSQRAHNYTAYLEQVRKEHVDKVGTAAFNTHKKLNHNEAIEELVTNAGNIHLLRETKTRLFPRVGQVYFEPDNSWGRAPFYSYEKNVGGYTLPTYFFNIIILIFFAVLAIIAIFAAFPGRFLRTDKDY